MPIPLPHLRLQHRLCLPCPLSLLSLHGDPLSSSDKDNPMLTSLHSFISSLSLPPLGLSTALEQHQQQREKNSVFIWVLQIKSNHCKMVDINHIAI
ncbi:hypothetical protein AAC387_Pa01g4093 [Persea americana]